MTCRAHDGLPARVSGPWSQEKLTYVQRYAGAFMTAMAPKRKPSQWSELVYLDFLAGPAHRVHYVRRPFHREPDFGVTSVNYDFGELLARADLPS